MPKFQEAGMKQDTDRMLLGRIVSQNRLIYHVLIEGEEKVGKISGKLQYETLNQEDYPVVGDWVYCKENYDEVVIESILPRKSQIIRKVAGGKSDVQVIATNIDKVFITMSLNNDFNVRRLERYLAIAWDSGAEPVILLTKADLCEGIEERVQEISLSALGVEIFVLSVVTGAGLEALTQAIGEEETVVFIGSSGVGKSSVVNALMGNSVQHVHEIDEHDKGRHTTTHRELFALPSGGMIIDTPGMRELQISQGDMETTFEDIEVLGRSCNFTDCGHHKEPGCAIRKAIESGTLSEERYGSYVKLKREMAIHEARKRHKEKINIKKHALKKKVVREKYDSDY